MVVIGILRVFSKLLCWQGRLAKKNSEIEVPGKFLEIFIQNSVPLVSFLPSLPAHPAPNKCSSVPLSLYTFAISPTLWYILYIMVHPLLLTNIWKWLLFCLGTVLNWSASTWVLLPHSSHLLPLVPAVRPCKVLHTLLLFLPWTASCWEHVSHWSVEEWGLFKS